MNYDTMCNVQYEYRDIYTILYPKAGLEIE